MPLGIGMAAFAALVLGVAMAGCYAVGRRRHRLTNLEELLANS
jgi:hypothetical protein